MVVRPLGLVGGFPTFQMSAGSLEKPSQFVVVDDHTFRVDFIRKDKMLMFNLAVVVPFVINSELAKRMRPNRIRGRWHG